MHHDTIEGLIAKWPAGAVVCFYHRNGFNTVVTGPDQMELTRHAIHGCDATGIPFALPLGEIVYAIIRADRKKK